MANSSVQVRAAHAGTKAEKLRLLPPWPEGIEISDTPLRREVRRGNRNPAGHILSAKMGRKLQYISPNERAFLILAEVDPNVIRIADRPLLNVAFVNGRDDQHYPDYAVLIDGVAEVHEVKSDDIYFGDQTLIRRYALHARSIEARDALYSIALRSELMEEPRFERAERLWPFSTNRISPEAASAVLMIVMRGAVVLADLMKELEEKLGGAAPNRGAVLGMVARGEIFCDLDGPIGAEMMVRPYDPAAMPNRLLPIRRPIDDLLDQYRIAA